MITTIFLKKVNNTIYISGYDINNQIYTCVYNHAYDIDNVKKQFNRQLKKHNMELLTC